MNNIVSKALLIILFIGSKGYGQQQNTNGTDFSKAGPAVVVFDGYEPLKDKPVPIWYYSPIDHPVDLPILFVCHGVKRNADDYRDNWIELANKHQIIIVAPEFSQEHYPQSRGYNLGNMFDLEGNPLPEEVWSFSVIDPIFDFVVEKIKGNQTSYDMFGHSAGAQFAHRFLMFKTGSKIHRVVSANAGWYTMPNFQIDFPYGLKNTALTVEKLTPILENNLIVLLGDRDTERSKYLRVTPEADAQGNNRYERGLKFFKVAQELSNAYDFHLRWTQETVSGVGHDNAQMAPFAAALLYGTERG